MSERHDPMTLETNGRGDDIVVVVVVAGLILIGALFLFAGQQGAGGTSFLNSHLPRVEAQATQ